LFSLVQLALDPLLQLRSVSQLALPSKFLESSALRVSSCTQCTSEKVAWFSFFLLFFIL
jgi:hypothetical protein